MGQNNKAQLFSRKLNKKKHYEWINIHLVDASRSHMLGVSVGYLVNGAEKQAYIQVNSDRFKVSKLFAYSIEDISYKGHILQVGENSFSLEQMTLHLIQNKFSLVGTVSFGAKHSLVTSGLSGGIMGPFKYVPWLSTYQEVLSLEHYLTGSLVINGDEINLDEGKGYIERLWGSSFPKTWLSIQCNQFKSHNCAVMIGVTRLSLAFNYYTVFSMPIFYNDKLEIFASHTGASIAKLYRYKGYVHLIVTQKDKVVEIKAFGEEDVVLSAAPLGGQIRNVYECLDTKIELRITQNGRVIFEDTGVCGYLKIGGNTSKLK